MQKRKSILTSDFDHCFLCGRPAECAHHIFFGPNRKNSEREGFIVPLCNECHNMSDHAVHFNRMNDLSLKRKCERKFLENHSLEEFMSIIGRNYL
nr:MAG TPA: Recombination enhancement, RecA-dependent nuclease [Caudoviricetes sp.]